jgi:DNA-directed RNA polymerase specialized sigma24 family protein
MGEALIDSPALTQVAGGGSSVQTKIHPDSVRRGLIAMLPRLKRFSDVLAGEAEQGRALLRRALIRMLREQHRYQRDTPLDHWAFAEIYRVWLQEARDCADSRDQAKARDAGFADLFRKTDDAQVDRLTASFLGELSPQQRSTLLLVYGEGFDHEDAGRVLDADPDTIAARLLRASASLADRLGSEAPVQSDAINGAPHPHACAGRP